VFNCTFDNPADKIPVITFNVTTSNNGTVFDSTTIDVDIATSNEFFYSSSLMVPRMTERKTQGTPWPLQTPAGLEPGNNTQPVTLKVGVSGALAMPCGTLGAAWG
jgi:hypothetical protein